MNASITMDMNQYREQMAAAHQAFTEQVTAMLAAYGKTQTVFTDALRGVERGFTDVASQASPAGEGS